MFILLFYPPTAGEVNSKIVVFFTTVLEWFSFGKCVNHLY